jgi:aryl-alcohol dehydrogenase-like predicted oxidoreductase
LLTGAITAETSFAVGDWRGDRQDDGPFADLARSLEVVDRIRPVAERLGCTLSQLALAWNVHQPGVTAAIAGSRNPEHVRANAAAGDIELDEATLAELDATLS